MIRAMHPRFITVTAAKFRHTQGQITIGFQTLIINLHVAGQFMGFSALIAFSRACSSSTSTINMFSDICPSGPRPPTICDPQLGGVHLDISATFLLAAHVILQGCVNLPSIWMPKICQALLLACGTGPFRAQLAVVRFVASSSMVRCAFSCSLFKNATP